MKSTLIIAMAATGLVLAGPVVAHHNSPISEELETIIPAEALDQHSAIVDDVLEMGVAVMSGASETGSMSGAAMDPADGPADGVYGGPGNDDMDGYGMDRNPPID